MDDQQPTERTESPHGAAEAPRANGRRWAGWIDLIGLTVSIAALVMVIGALQPRFLSTDQWSSIANQIPELLVIVIGMTLVLIVGGIDLSVGSVMALSSAVIGVLLERKLGLIVAVPAGIAAGAVCGAINGGISIGLRVPSFIVTLGMLQGARGLAYLLTDSQTVYLGKKIGSIASPLPGIGVSTAFLVALLLAIVAQLLLGRTILGRHLVAIGTNEGAVRLSGIRVWPAKLFPFVLVGAMAGLAGWFSSARLSSVNPNEGNGIELSAIAAVVIGGTSLMGGRGSVTASFLGVVLVAVLTSGLAALNVSEPYKLLITGGVIVAAVLVDVLRRRESR
ncbi:MAG TPA: ABC transporter permease [Planctomycetaceae bacterium]|nr:ABC transporter permease [Planctomycetaceae bacterium]